MTDDTHLRCDVSDRGLAYYPPLPSTYGGEVEVHASSHVEPHVWLTVTCPVDLNDPAGPAHEAIAHVRVADAWRLADQLRALVRARYPAYPERYP